MQDGKKEGVENAAKDGTTGFKFVPLHNHSYYSILDGMASPEDLAAAAKREGFPAIALTDHGTMAGVYAFQKACKKQGIKPILGNEVYICKDHNDKSKDSKTHHLTLLAKNQEGLRNLMRMATIGELEGKYRKPRIDFDILSKHHEGLICLSGCPVAELPMAIWHEQPDEVIRLINAYKELFGDDYYIEIMTHKYGAASKDQEVRERKVAKELYRLAKQYEIKAVCTNDAHYANKEDAQYHDILLAIQTNSHIKDPDRFSFNGDEFYVKGYQEMLAIYSHAPELLSNTVEIAEKIENDLIKYHPDLLPKYDTPVEFDSDVAYLKALVKDGMKAYGFIDKPEYRDRIKFEMEAIIRCGYVRYFLILWDIINFAKRQGIRTGIGRGCFLPENLVDCKDAIKKIAEVRIGDKVLAYDDKYHEVIDTINYDIDEEIVEIEMEDGRKVSCTSDHKIHIKRGKELVWIEASELTEDDDIYDIRVGD